MRSIEKNLEFKPKWLCARGHMFNLISVFHVDLIFVSHLIGILFHQLSTQLAGYTI
jgi:hypothetical protein